MDGSLISIAHNLLRNSDLTPYDFVADLKAVILESAPFKPAEGSAIAEGESRLPSGLAVSPSMAARCANEPLRTHRFIEGLNRAVEAQLESEPGRAVSVLYAGCGPWATLALPLLAHYPASQLQLTLLDIHQESMDSAQALIEKLGLSDGVADYVVADACEYRIPEGEQPDIIVTETMSVALWNEPQVALSRNLLAQAPDAVLIPERVQIDLVLLDPAREHSVGGTEPSAELPPPERERVPLGEVFRLDRENIARWQGESGDTLPAATIRLPDFLDPRLQLTLMTSITTYDDISLRDYDCSLTVPTRLKTEAPVVAGKELKLEYQLGSCPGFITHQEITVEEQEVAAVSGDRKRLPLSFDNQRLLEDLEGFDNSEWIDHFVRQNYEGSWQAIPLRAQAGATHPIQQIFSNPSATEFCDTEFLKRSPYFSEVLQQFQCELLSVRLMKLDAGSSIKEHIDPDLAMEEGYARLHIPITTNPQMEFVLNGRPVTMHPGECWYLRLSDPHYLNNYGDSDRVHIVLDVVANKWLSSMIEKGW